jgi:hypothetical protein
MFPQCLGKCRFKFSARVEGRRGRDVGGGYEYDEEQDTLPIEYDLKVRKYIFLG